MTLLEELEEYVNLHRPHGALLSDAGAPTPNGYMLTAGCPCGVTFMRWVTPDDAALDLALLHLHSGNQVAGARQQGCLGVLAAAVALLTPIAAWTHSGGLDTYGCHHDRKRGGYHCHRGELAGKSFTSKEVENALRDNDDRAAPILKRILARSSLTKESG